MLLKNHTFTGAVVVFILMSPGASQGQVAQKERVLVVPATVVPFDKADLFPRETGVLRNVKADMGSRVKKGDVLAEIDNASVVADWEFARSSLEQAKSNVKLEEGKVHRFQSMVQSARSVVLTKKAGLGAVQSFLSFRETELRRTKKLAAKNLVAADDVDIAASAACTVSQNHRRRIRSGQEAGAEEGRHSARTRRGGAGMHSAGPACFHMVEHGARRERTRRDGRCREPSGTTEPASARRAYRDRGCMHLLSPEQASTGDRNRRRAASPLRSLHTTRRGSESQTRLEG